MLICYGLVSRNGLVLSLLGCKLRGKVGSGLAVVMQHQSFDCLAEGCQIGSLQHGAILAGALAIVLDREKILMIDAIYWANHQVDAFEQGEQAW